MIKSILAAITTSFIIATAYAEEIKEVVTNPIVISATRQPSLYSEVSRIVTVLSNEQISNAPVKNIEELLEYVSSVDVRRRGGPSAQADYSIRGGTFDQTLILLNGTPLNSPQTGHLNGNLPISVNDIERIEILEGSGARVLGTNAFSGGINIITKKSSEGTSAHIAASGGEYGFYDLNASANIALPFIFNSFNSVYKQKSDGYMDNTDTDVINAYSFNSLNSSIGDFTLQLGANLRKYGANSFYTALFPNQYEETSTGFVSFSYAKSYLNWNISAQTFASILYDKFELFRAMKDAPEWYSGHNYHKTQTIGGDLKASFESQLGISSIGIEIKREDIVSNVLGKPMSKPVKVSGTDNAFYTNEDYRNNLSIFAEQSFSLDNFFASLGAMFNYNSFFDNQIYGGIDLGYKITNSVNVFATINQSGRLPNFTDLYYEGPTNRGNPNLKPEQSTSFEIGTKYIDNKINASFSLFHNQGKDLIDWIKHPDSTVWETQNLTKLNTYGFQTSLTVIPKEIFGENCPVKFASLGYTYISSDKESEKMQSLFALDYLRHKFVLTTGIGLGLGFGLDVRISYQEREGTYYSYEKDAELPYKNVLLVASRFYFQYENFSFFVDIDNILDNKYQDIANIVLPGRWARVGFNFDINPKNGK